jgi:capsular exopolysaccharide synthesis family protein
MERPLISEPSVLDLRAYLTILKRRKWVVVTATALALGIALFLSVRQTPIYQAETDVLVEPIDLTPATPVGLSNPNMDTEERLAKSTLVAEIAATKLPASGTLASLRGHVSVSIAMNTSVLQFKYVDASPQRAQIESQAFASAYIDFRKGTALSQLQAASQGLQEQIRSLDQQYQRLSDQIARTPQDQRLGLQAQANALVLQLSTLHSRLGDLVQPDSLEVGRVVAPAQLPTSPVSPSYPKNIGVAIVIGLVLGLVVALIRERLDDDLRSPDDLESSARAPVLGLIPKIAAWRDPSQDLLVSVTDPLSPAAESYRALRARTLAAMSVIGAKTLLVTSSHPGEGKSSTSANLGVAVARGGKKVLLVSADRRRPRLHAYFEAPVGPGLTEVLTGELSLSEVVVNPGVDNLRLLPSGLADPEGDQLGDSDSIGRLLNELGHLADVVIVDATPLLGLADALSLVPMVDAVLMVADGKHSTRSEIRHARQQFDQLGARMLGTVLNNVKRADSGVYGYYGYGYGYGQGKGNGSKRRRGAEMTEPGWVTSQVKQSSHP